MSLPTWEKQWSCAPVTSFEIAKGSERERCPRSFLSPRCSRRLRFPFQWRGSHNGALHGPRNFPTHAGQRARRKLANLSRCEGLLRAARAAGTSREAHCLRCTYLDRGKHEIPFFLTLERRSRKAGTGPDRSDDFPAPNVENLAIISDNLRRSTLTCTGETGHVVLSDFGVDSRTNVR